MKKITVALLVTLLTAACSTPGELRAKGKHFITRTSLAPDAAARCLLKNLEASSSALRGRVMPIGDGKYELLIWTTDDWILRTTHDSRLLAEIGPGDLGVTQIDSWFPRDALDVEVNGSHVIQGWLKGC